MLPGAELYVISIWPLLTPLVGIATVTWFGTMSPGATFRFDVDGAPVASPGRTEINPAPVGDTAVTFNNTPVAPTGTTTRLIDFLFASVQVLMVPVTCNFFGCLSNKFAGDTNVGTGVEHTCWFHSHHC